VHASIFFVLTLSWLLALNGFGKFSIVVQMLTVATCVLYGGLLEIMQATLFSQRSGDWLDFIANSVGCFTAFWSFKRSAIA
jgi:VanZ family protein